MTISICWPKSSWFFRRATSCKPTIIKAKASLDMHNVQSNMMVDVQVRRCKKQLLSYIWCHSVSKTQYLVSLIPYLKAVISVHSFGERLLTRISYMHVASSKLTIERMDNLRVVVVNRSKITRALLNFVLKRILKMSSFRETNGELHMFLEKSLAAGVKEAANEGIKVGWFDYFDQSCGRKPVHRGGEKPKEYYIHRFVGIR